MPKAKTAPNNEKAKRGIKARVDAINTLIENHREEFEEAHMRNRVKAGLPPRTAGPSKEELRERIRKQEERLSKWRRELDLQS